MSDQISTIEDTRRRATQAWRSGRTIAEVGPNWHSAAYQVWVEVYAELDTEQAISRSRRQEEAA